MNPPDAQSDSDLKETYFDPEELDASEQYFSASLETSAAKPQFVIDSAEKAGSFSHNVSSNPQPLERRESCPPEPIDSQGAPDIQSASDWRDVVSEKVKHYKTLKPRKERYPSLQLQFDSAPTWKLEQTPASRAANDPPAAITPDTSPSLPGDRPLPQFLATTEATARVLEFPRPGMLPFNRDELAEPVVDRPRIIEAPELVPPPPALGGILIEPPREPEPERQPGLDMPLATATLSRRVFAATIDGVFIVAGLAIFEYMFLRFNSSLPPSRSLVAITVAFAGILWFAYQFSFLTFCGNTPGLRATRLRIARFDGAPAPRNIRRWRVLASVLSCVSLGLGYAWCFFDEDQLTWHDRITRTHLAPK